METATHTATTQAPVVNGTHADEANDSVIDHVSNGENLVVLEAAVDDGTVVKTAGTLFFTAFEVIEVVSRTRTGVL